MQRDEIKERQRKEAEERKQRRELVDGAGAGAMGSLLGPPPMDNGFEVADD